MFFLRIPEGQTATHQCHDSIVTMMLQAHQPP